MLTSIKVKCDKVRPTCHRCSNMGMCCKYSPSMRLVTLLPAQSIYVSNETTDWASRARTKIQTAPLCACRPQQHPAQHWDLDQTQCFARPRKLRRARQNPMIPFFTVLLRQNSNSKTLKSQIISTMINHRYTLTLGPS